MTKVYREIEESEVAIDAPITTSLVTALRDNLEAITEGHSSAPTTVTNSKSCVIGLDAFKTGTPSAGNHIIMESTGHSVGDDTSVISLTCRTTGNYRIILHSRVGITERAGDVLPPNSQARVRVYQSGVTDAHLDATISTFTSYFTSSTTGNPTIYLGDWIRMVQINKDIDITAGDVITVDVDDEPVGTSKAQVSTTLQVGVADSDALYGVDFRSTLT